MNQDIIKIYGLDKRLKRIFQILEEDNKITKRDKKVLREYSDNLSLEGLSLSCNVKYMSILVQLSRKLKIGFEKAKMNDIKNMILDIEKNPNYKDWTKYLFKVSIRKFYKWLKKCDKPEEVAWIKAVMKHNSDKLPEQMLSEDDIKKLIIGSRSCMYRAFISLLYESGCRVG